MSRRSLIGQVASLAARPIGAASQLASRPIALAGRDSPLHPLNLLDRLHGPQSLEDAVGGRVVLITGASSGIGQAAARRVGGAGAVVVLVARGADKLEETRVDIEAVGGIAHVHPCDLTDLEAIDRMAAEVLERHGPVDVLVNNAGRSIRRSVALSYDRFHDFERTMALNYFAAVRLILRLLPSMRERRSGHIVNISSAGVQTRVPRFSSYIASKAALDTFSDAVQAEVREDGVHFTTIHMPLVRTPMIAPTGLYKSFPALSPEEAGELIAQALVRRPRRVSPAFGSVAALADAFSPQVMDLVRSRGYQMFGDSRAARGSGDSGPAVDRGDDRALDERASAIGNAFARATRGVHW